MIRASPGLLPLLKIALAGLTTLLALLLQFPPLLIGLVPAVCLASMLAGSREANQAWGPQKFVKSVVWAASFFVWGWLFTSRLDPLYAAVGIGCAVTLALEVFGGDSSDWRGLALAWAGVSAVLLLAAGYAVNEPWSFYLGWSLLLITVALLVLSLAMPFRLVQLALGLGLFILVLPLVDLLLKPGYAKTANPRLRPYSFTVARKDPTAFEHWWNYYREQWDSMGRQVFEPDPSGQFPLRLREGARGQLAESVICINQHGYRGADFPLDKGEEFRIVALGESTTFGCTLNKEDRAWPEILEEIIEERVKPSRPVRVINAGVPAYTLLHNVERLPTEILPLKPDLVISYHGYNGFRLLDEALPAAHGKSPPAYKKRPLKLLGDLDHRIRVWRWSKNRPIPVDTAIRKDFRTTPYAEAYRKLIETCRTNGLQLALASFSMAVNSNSPSEVIEFYRSGFPSIYGQIAANEAHSKLLESMIEEYKDLLLIDTRPALDGENEKFVDLIHLTQEGRKTLAEAVFEELRPLLPR